jgi:hypothetical protein
MYGLAFSLVALEPWTQHLNSTTKLTNVNYGSLYFETVI